MKLAIVGQGQLAQVTAICCEPYHERVQPKDAEVLWVCYDTPLKANHEPDVEWVQRQLCLNLFNTSSGSHAHHVLVSSPLPVGTIRRFEEIWHHLSWAYSPENIRVAHGVEDFMHQVRIVVGRRNSVHDAMWIELLGQFSPKVLFCSPETAEMVKHATNAYLAMCIAFANEIDVLSREFDANGRQVLNMLQLDPRCSPLAPMTPGPAYGGGHLDRDLAVLNSHYFDGVKTPIINNITYSNDLHREHHAR